MTKCSNCFTEETPMWRRCVDTKLGSFITLCNACGLYYKAKGDHRPRLLITKKSQITKYEHLMNCLASEADETENKMVQFNDEDLSDVRIISCVNCKCINTSLWRKDQNGNSMCNACGLYFKKNGMHRPVKEDDRDVFIEIDSNVIRFNKIKRRKRSASRVHEKAYERATTCASNEMGIKKIQMNDTHFHGSSKPHSQAVSHSSYASDTSDHSPTSPYHNIGMNSPQAEMNYTLSATSALALSMQSTPMSALPPASLLLPQSTHIVPNNNKNNNERVQSTQFAPRLPPISFLLNAIDVEAQSGVY